jgi:hypothetical protein
MLRLASVHRTQIHEILGPNVKINLVDPPMHSTELTIQPTFSESPEWWGAHAAAQSARAVTGNQHSAHLGTCTPL